jgi:C-terminal processing protease CtpA/Prc
MYLQPGKAHEREDHYDRSGMSLVRDHDALRVASVVPGGPAEMSGVRVDDRIVGINGKPIDARALRSVTKYFRESTPGTEVHLRLERRPGVGHDATLALAELVP